jgi:hypothetical protein
VGIVAALLEATGVATANEFDATLIEGLMITVFVGTVLGGITGIWLVPMLQNPAPPEETPAEN